MKRLLLLVVLAGFAGAIVSARAEIAFDFGMLQQRAKDLAAKPYVPRPSRVPERLRALTYDQHRDIRFSPDHAWWRDEKLPFQLQFFHPGFILRQTVQISEVDDGKATPIPFDKSLFNYGQNRDLGEIPGDMGYSGFRIHYALNNPDYLDELAVFQGASYFRALGRFLHYGLSARGLALNTAEAGGEEFPVFEEFYIEKPRRRAKEIVVYALLDSPSVSGAYRFAIDPGDDTVMTVRAAVYVRKGAAVRAFGMAPLTSMFWHGENSGTSNGDLRPEVHDSDGLLMERGNGEWLWRPLANPAQMRVVSFFDENPKGFGLVQRDRDFAHYQDLEAYYHQRPSAWIEPVGDWGRGMVRLVELNTLDETNDNIVAFWVPEQLPAPGQPVEFSYKLHWFQESTGGKKPPAGYAIATRIGQSKTHEPELIRFWVDFDGAQLQKRGADAGLEAVVSVGDGAKLVHQAVQKNTFDGTWRVAFALKPDGSKRPVELRCFLRKDPHVLTETWTYLWNP